MKLNDDMRNRVLAYLESAKDAETVIRTLAILGIKVEGENGTYVIKSDVEPYGDVDWGGLGWWTDYGMEKPNFGNRMAVEHYGQALACNYLSQRGYTILTQNPMWHIDIVAMDPDGMYVLMKVKVDVSDVADDPIPHGDVFDDFMDDCRWYAKSIERQTNEPLIWRPDCIGIGLSEEDANLRHAMAVEL